MGFSGSSRSELEVPAQQVALAPGLSAILTSHPGVISGDFWVGVPRSSLLETELP